MTESIKCYFHILLLLLSVTAIAQPEPPPDGPIDSRMRKEVIDSLASILVDGYYDPLLAKSMVSQIWKYRKAGRYDTINRGQQFALELTKNLQEVSLDQHIQVEYVKRTVKNDLIEEKAEKDKIQKAFMEAVNHGFDKVERLPGNVGLLELRTFSTIAEAASKIDAAMSFLANTDALIIDLRYNRGGHPATVQYLASYLLESKPKLLNILVWRSPAGNQPVRVTRNTKGPGLIEQSWSYPVLPGQRYDQKPVYVLLSEITASGAEEFAYVLQALGRATIVGNTSAGAANPGGTDSLTDNFQIFIPRGQAHNPITNKSWERTGVKPNLPSTFEHAIKVAYIHALEHIEQRGNYAGPEPIKILLEDAKKELMDVTNKK